MAMPPLRPPTGTTTAVRCSVSRALPPPSVHAKLRNDDRYDNPEFYPCNGFCTVLPGGNSCYGDQLIAVAEHLVRCRGVDGEDDPLGPADTRKLIDGLESTFGGASAYGPWPADPDAPRPDRRTVAPRLDQGIPREPRRGKARRAGLRQRRLPGGLLLQGHTRRLHVCRSSRPVGSRRSRRAIDAEHGRGGGVPGCRCGDRDGRRIGETGGGVGGRGEGGREYPRPRDGPRARRGDNRDGADLLSDGRGLPREPSADEIQPQESGEFGGLIDAPGAAAAAARAPTRASGGTITTRGAYANRYGSGGARRVGRYWWVP